MENWLENRTTLLYPLMILAAISVIVFSVVGIATMTGRIPSALSTPRTEAEQAAMQRQEARRPAAAARQATRRAEAVAVCSNCAVIEAIREIDLDGKATGVGMVAGGVTGGLLGNQIGHGGGRTAATILGAAGGAYVGNEIEKNTRKSTGYRITLRMEDGSYRSVTQRSHPGYGVGDKVRVVDGSIVGRV